MVDGSDLSQHINMFNQVISDLRRVDVKFEDEDKALIRIHSQVLPHMRIWLQL
jgi:hypothetical protein